MTDNRLVEVNPPAVYVGFRMPPVKTVPETIGNILVPATGEVVSVTRSLEDPFTFMLSGKKLIAVVDMRAMFSEVVMHVDARNVK